MGVVLQLIGSLLSALHRGIPLPFCDGDWLLTTAAAGACLAAIPTVGALLVALLRKAIGNRYGVAGGTTIVVVGLAFFLSLPWLTFRGVGRVFGDLAAGIAVGGIDPAALEGHSCFVASQADYLGGGPSVYVALLHSSGDRMVHALYLLLLVILPIIALVFVWLQTRAATRRGSAWPRRMLWLPFVVFGFTTALLPANVMVELWLGFVPASLIGALLVFLVGPPRWSVLNRERRSAPDELPGEPPPADTGEPERSRPATRLADTPGPLPFQPEAAAPPALLVAGGRFRRVRTLGKGGFGTVWLAVDTQLDRTVAVKFAHAPDSETEQRMLREARALAAVRHPNCVRIYDIVSAAAEGAGLGIVMEYIEGRPLAEAVQDAGHLDDMAAARLWATMAGALQAAHDKGVLHRDVKPSNVIVDGAGIAHLIDFGIARSEGDATLTATGMMVGTPDFLAPETAAGRAATPPSDAWQLAATVAFALSGEPPRGYRESTMAAFTAAANGEECARLPRNSVHYRLLQAVLDTDPARRPTLRTVHRELTRWLSRAGASEEGPVTTWSGPVSS